MVHVYFINCFNAKLYQETLPVAMDCEIDGVRCHDVTNMLQRRIFQFPPVIIVVAYGRLKPIIENFKQSSAKSGHL